MTTIKDMLMLMTTEPIVVGYNLKESLESVVALYW